MKCMQTVSYHKKSENKNNYKPGQSKLLSDPEGKIVYGINVVKADK